MMNDEGAPQGHDGRRAPAARRTYRGGGVGRACDEAGRPGAGARMAFRGPYQT